MLNIMTYKNIERTINDKAYEILKENVINDYNGGLKTIEIARKYDIAYYEVLDILGHDYAKNQSDKIVKEVALCVCDIT